MEALAGVLVAVAVLALLAAAVLAFRSRGLDGDTSPGTPPARKDNQRE